MENLSVIAYGILISGTLSIICLGALHFISPQYHPSWRMVSEYALGKHKWVLTLFFYSWGISSILAAWLCGMFLSSIWGIIGAILVAISGVGAIMGGMFDIKHRLHGLAFAIGIPPLPVGALLVSYALVEQSPFSSHSPLILATAHSIWISIILMGWAMAMLMSGFKKAGIPVGPNVAPPTSLPDGVIGLSGYVNRLMILCCLAWVLLLGYTCLTMA